MTENISNKCTGIREIRSSDILIEDRQRENLGDLNTLAFSIETYGQLTPIVVQDIGNGKYRLLDGERRLKALKLLEREMVEARLYEDLDPVEQQRIELEANIRRKALTPVEEARAIRRIFEEEKKQHEHFLPGRFGRGFTQKDLAEKLDISQSNVSVSLRIADAADNNPGLETCKSRREVMQKIATGTSKPKDDTLETRMRECFIVEADPMEYIMVMPKNSVDLAIIDVDAVPKNLFEELNRKIAPGGCVIVFHPLIHLSLMRSYALKEGFKGKPDAYIWHSSRESSFSAFSWYGKMREAPLRYMTPHCTYARDETLLHSKAKPMSLMEMLIKHNSEQGASVLIAPCFDANGIQFCLANKRNVVGVCPNRILRDKAILAAN
jgi:hypothetical protein